MTCHHSTHLSNHVLADIAITSFCKSDLPSLEEVLS
jgi:hypothetical protein